MKTIVGIFTSWADAKRAVERLRSIGIADKDIDLLAPGASEKEIQSVSTTDTEQPGMGAAMGGVVGGALGASGGMSLGAAAASLLVPGVGPIIASGIIGAALLGAGGAAAGAAAGGALEENADTGLPKDELFVYEDALRQGRALVIAVARDDAQVEAVREALVEAGAEDLNSARDNWWVGLRDAEKARYSAEGKDFDSDEPVYRRGFESALRADARGKSYDEVQERLRDHHPDCYGEECFRRGYERGQAYHQELREKYKA